MEWELYADRGQLAAMLVLNKPASGKVRDMSFSHSQLLNTDQPPKKQVFMQLIAWVVMISGLLAAIGILTGVVWLIVEWILSYSLSGIPLWRG